MTWIFFFCSPQGSIPEGSQVPQGSICSAFGNVFFAHQGCNLSCYLRSSSISLIHGMAIVILGKFILIDVLGNKSRIDGRVNEKEGL